jgi:ERF superfamily.
MEKQTNDEQNTLFAESSKEAAKKKEEVKKEEVKKPVEPYKSEYANMNIYQKMQLAKVKVQEQIVKKSGNNKYSGFDYLKLEDFLPIATKVFYELGLYPKFNIYKEVDKETGLINEKAVLAFVDTDHVDSTAIVFERATADGKVSGATPVQNEGAKASYMTRYMYISALDLAVPDGIDERSGFNGDEDGNGKLIPDNGKREITGYQLKKLTELCTELPEKAESMLEYYKVKGIAEMDEITASKAIKQMTVAKAQADAKAKSDAKASEQNQGEVVNG